MDDFTNEMLRGVNLPPLTAQMPPRDARLTIGDLDAIAERAYGDGFKAADRENRERLNEAVRERNDLRQQVAQAGEWREAAERQLRDAHDALIRAGAENEGLKHTVEVLQKPVPEDAGKGRVGPDAIAWQRG